VVLWHQKVSGSVSALWIQQEGLFEEYRVPFPTQSIIVSQKDDWWQRGLAYWYISFVRWRCLLWWNNVHFYLVRCLEWENSN
jgi:hypothetical protein